MMLHYKDAYELEGLDALDLALCLDTDYNQPDYDGSRQVNDQAGEQGPDDRA